MATIPELLDGHITLEVECLDRLYLNGYVGKLATPGGLVTFMREQLGKPIPSPVVLGQITERFREAVKSLAQRRQIPVHEFKHKEKKDDIANQYRRERGIRDGIVFIGVAQERAQAFQGKKVNGRFEFDRDKTVYVNHYYFYIDDADFGPLFLKVCSYAPWGIKLCLNGHEWAKRHKRWTTDSWPAPMRHDGNRSVILWGRSRSTRCSANGSSVSRCAYASKTARPATIGICRCGRWKSV